MRGGEQAGDPEEGGENQAALHQAGPPAAVPADCVQIEGGGDDSADRQGAAHARQTSDLGYVVGTFRAWDPHHTAFIPSERTFTLGNDDRDP